MQASISVVPGVPVSPSPAVLIFNHNYYYYMFKLNRVGVAICSRYHHRSIVVATPERLKNSVDLDLQIACIDYNLYV